LDRHSRDNVLIEQLELVNTGQIGRPEEARVKTERRPRRGKRIERG